MKEIIKILTTFSKKRDKLLKNKIFLSIIIYFVLLFIIDYSGIFDYYGQSIIRRSVNMFRRVDPLNYKNKLKPFCVKYEKLLENNDVLKLQSIKIPDKTDFGIFSRVNTSTHQCCNNYSEQERAIMEEVTMKIKAKYEERIGKKLYLMSNGVNSNSTLYRYNGNNSKHLWHVDPQNISEIYNVILCVKKVGGISPLMCKDVEGKEYSIHFEEGDGAFFNGGTTVHQVPPNQDPNSSRTVLSIAFTTSEKISLNKNQTNNLCTFLEGGNNYKNLLKLWVSMFILNLVLSYVSGINNLSYTFIFGFFFINLLITKYLPLYYDIGLGSGRASSIYYNLLILLWFVVTTISVKGAVIMFSYFILSDVFFSRKWVEYD